MTKEEEKAIEIVAKYLNFNEICGTRNFKEAIEIVLNILKQNSAELAEKSAEIEKKDKKDKIIDLMAERIEWLCKSNGILLDKEHDENFTQEDIKKHFERKVNE